MQGKLKAITHPFILLTHYPRHGYDTIFVDRQMILKALWQNLKHKDNVLVSKKVTEVELQPSRVKVKTGDGSSYHGDILVGADGVHSKVRNEMWRLADILEPGYIPCSEHKGETVLGLHSLYGD